MPVAGWNMKMHYLETAVVVLFILIYRMKKKAPK